MSKKKEQPKAKWNIHLSGRPPFAMVGAIMTREEAVEFASGIWTKEKVQVS